MNKKKVAPKRKTAAKVKAAPTPAAIVRKAKEAATRRFNKAKQSKADAPPLPKTDEEQKVAERRAKAMEMRVQGATYRTIAKTLNVSLAQAYDDVKTVMAETRVKATESAEEYVEMELARLDMALAAIRAATKAGNVKAVAEWRKLSESRRRLLGLNKQGEEQGGTVTGVVMVPMKATIEEWQTLVSSVPIPSLLPK